MRSVKRVVAVCALLLGSAAGWAAAATALPCADWVSTGINDAPGVGYLIGSETLETTAEINLGWFKGTVKTTYEVGTYEFSNGVQLKIDCRDYTLV
jgi:hypothetical protein